MPSNPPESSPKKASPAEGFSQLVEIMARLRAPDGCPWDREQTFDTIKPYLLEETYEVMQAIDDRDWPGLADELGDLLLQAVFFSQLASEAGHFDIGDALEAITSKLIRRHPHVFGDAQADTADEVLRNWDAIKATEKAERPKGLLERVSASQPALMEARQLSSKAARAGFDWPAIEHVIEKLHEELGELDAARQAASDGQPGGSKEEIEGEIGDLLFVVVNMARFLEVDPEQALRKTNAKFRRRFGHVERGLEAQGKSLLGPSGDASGEASIDEMEALWQEAKRGEDGSR